MKNFNFLIFFKSILPDAISICGISLIGYGLFIFEPWVSFTVVGALVLLFGLFLGKREAISKL